MKRLNIAALVTCVLLSIGCRSTFQSPVNTESVADSAIGRAFATGTSNVEVEGEGKVTRILPDDLSGSPHQRFIVSIESGQTVLIAHNINVAPRIEKLREGDFVRFYGEYVWNETGGLVHWTHHDPAARHLAGWIKHNRRVYQ